MEALAGDALRRSGSLRLAVDDAEREALAREFEALIDDGFAADWLDPLPPPLDGSSSARFVHPRDGALQPGPLGATPRRHAAAAGAEIVEHVPVDRRGDRRVRSGCRRRGRRRPHRRARSRSCTVDRRGAARCSRPSRCRSSSTTGRTTPAGASTTGSSCPTGGSWSAAAATRARDREHRERGDDGRRSRRELEALAEQLIGGPPRSRTAGRASGARRPTGCRSSGRSPVRPASGSPAATRGHGNVLGFACGDLVARAILGEPAPELDAFDPGR